MFGGRTTSGDRLADTWIYDIAANEWTELSPADVTERPRRARDGAWRAIR